MRKIFVLGCLFAASSFAQSSETATFLALMSPANEVPAIEGSTAGATAVLYAHVMRDAQGQIVSGSVDFVVPYNLPDVTEVTGLHIHNGAAGVNGPVTINSGIGSGANAVPVAAPFRGTIVRQGQVISTNATALATLRGMFQNPGDYYANLHTSANPGGLIRGQLMRAERTVLLGRMLPGNEVPAITNIAASGVASVEAVRAYNAQNRYVAGVVIFDVDYNFPGATTFTGLHIHSGAAGVNGPVIINTGISGGANSVTTPGNGQGNLFYRVDVPAANQQAVATLEGLFDNPEAYYINLHTTTNPGGVIRSQLYRTEQITFPVSLSPANEVPAVTGVDASGQGALHINALRDQTGNVTAARVTFDVNHRFPAEVTFTGMHIHDAAKGVNGPVTINSGIAGAERSVLSTTGFGNLWRPINVGSGQALTSLNSILQNPEKHYLNVHSSTNAGGIIRAQLAADNTKAPRIVEVISAVSDLNVRTLAPSGQFTIFGEDLAKVPTQLGGLVGLQLPKAVNGTSVSIGGMQAPIVALGYEPRNNPSGYIVAQVPVELAAGQHPVTVTSANGTSNARTVTVAAVAPAVFFDTLGTFAVRVSDFSIVRPDSGARAGEPIAIVMTGLGQTTPALTTGQIPNTANMVSAPVTVTIGGRAATVSGATTIPGFPGIYIVLVTVPEGLGGGTAPVIVRANGVAGNTTSLPVR